LSNLAAIACVYDYGRGSDIEETLSYSSHFSDVIHSQDKYPSKGIAFISLDRENISYVMAYKKSGRVATKIDRLTFTKPIQLEQPFSIDDIQNAIPNKLQRYFKRQTSIGISAFSPKVYQALNDYIRKINPSLLTSINQLKNEISDTPTKYKGHSAEIIAHEKDAISLALRISGFTDYDIPPWNQESDTAPFLRGYDNIVLREDPMVIHDSQVFGDWEKISQFVVGAAEFVKDGHKLTIMNVNRHKIEETLGVDLLMYHHTYKSYVLIQYKRMIKDGESLSYRPGDMSYAAEIRRMESFQKQSQTIAGSKPNDYRLNDDFFYFKLCPADIKEPLSTKMITGMYIPLCYWNILLSSDSTLGEKGGRKLSYSNVDRYINNTLFTELMQSGWIGNQVSDTELITNQIQESIAGGNSLVLANYAKNENNA
jgi:hypothetical protein